MVTMIPEGLRNAGLRALQRELGAVGTVRFIQQFETGPGNYTVDRWRLPGELDVDGLAQAIEQELIAR